MPLWAQSGFLSRGSCGVPQILCWLCFVSFGIRASCNNSATRGPEVFFWRRADVDQDAVEMKFGSGPNRTYQLAFWRSTSSGDGVQRQYISARAISRPNVVAV